MTSNVEITDLYNETKRVATPSKLTINSLNAGFNDK
jgi:hypothetical protein